jgi:hypothetical protein
VAALTKIPVIYKKDYTVLFEAFADKLWIHCKVNKWSKTVKQSLKQDFNTLMSLVNLPVFALHDPEDLKHKKFLNLFGFVYLKDTLGKDNKPRQIFFRSK